MRRLFISLFCTVWMPLMVSADSARLTPLFEAMRMPELLEIMRQEGVDHAAALREGMFPGKGGKAWSAAVEHIYDPDRLAELMSVGFGDAPNDAALHAMTAFFESGIGRRISGLEIATRRAMLDPGVDEAMREALSAMIAEHTERMELLAEFVEVNDLVEANVVGGLNANLAFHRGLRDGQGLTAGMTEAEILTHVMAQEPKLREDVTEWLYAFLAAAYSPLEDEELRRYIDVSATEEGRIFNRALFAAFDTLLTDVSYRLGIAAARLVQGEDI
ncbi:MAG: hypothetical protein AAF982_12330 [Pseudomonadota bacterium]